MSSTVSDPPRTHGAPAEGGRGALDPRVEEGPDWLGRLLLLAALLLSLLRFASLGEWSLWIDEAFTLADLSSAATFDNPLGYWITGQVLELLGRTDEAALRTTSALFGVLCVPLTFWCFRTAAGHRAAALAALLLAVSSWHLYWSQSARFYTIAMALSLVGSGLVLRSLGSGGALRFVAGLGVAALAAAAHPTGAIVLPGLVGTPIVARRLRLRVPSNVRLAAVLIALVGGLASAGWLWGMLGYWGTVKSGGGIAHLVLTTGFYVTPLLGAAALFGAVVVLLGRRRAERAALLFVPVLALAVGALVATQVRMTAQYVFVLLPWFCALAGLPIAERRSDPAGRSWRSRLPWPALAWSGLLALPALSTCVLYLGPRLGERPQWREAYATVFARKSPGDLVVGMAAPVGEYYLDPRKRDVRDLEQVVYLDQFRFSEVEFWDRYARRTWFVVNHEEFEDWPEPERGRIERILAEDCRLVARFPLIVESRDLSVSVYRRD